MQDLYSVRNLLKERAEKNKAKQGEVELLGASNIRGGRQ